MIFFFDRNIPIRLAKVVGAYDPEHTVIHQDNDNRFRPQSTDIEIISQLANDKPKPVFVTADEAMRRNANERKALADSQLTLIFFKAGWHQLDFHTRAVKLLDIWPVLTQTCQHVREPTAFEITAVFKKLDLIGPTLNL